MLARVAVIWDLDQGWRIYFEDRPSTRLACGCWSLRGSHSWLDCLGIFLTQQLASSRESDLKHQGGNTKVLSGLISEVTHEDFCHILLVTRTTLMWGGRGLHKNVYTRSWGPLGAILKAEWWIHFWIDWIITRKVVDWTRRDWKVLGGGLKSIWRDHCIFN